MKFRVLLLLWAVCGLLAAPAAVVTADVVLVLKNDAAVPDTTAPTVQNVTVDGPVWTIQYNEPVTGQTGFTAVGSTTGAVTLTGSAGNGTHTHTFTGSAPAVFGETFTIDYAPGNAVDDADNALAAIDDRAVTNSTLSPGDVTPPTLDTKTISTSGTSATFVFSEVVYGQGGFTGTGSITGALTFTYVSGSGTNTHLYSVTQVEKDETVTVSYNDATATDDLEDESGNKLADITNGAVTNGSLYEPSAPDVTAPTIEGVEIVNGDQWRFTFDEAVTGSGGFSGTGASVGAIALTLASGNGTATHVYTADEAVSIGEVVTYDYDDALASDDLEDASGNKLADVTAGAVTNSTTNVTTTDFPVITPQRGIIIAAGGSIDYTPTVEQAGAGGLEYTATGLPTNCSINATTGQITGTNLTAGYYRPKITVTDDNGNVWYHWIAINVYSSTVTIDQTWLDNNDGGTAPWYLDVANCYYTLDVDVTAPQTAFVINKSGVIFDLGGHTVTYDAADYSGFTVFNGDFETVDGGDPTHAAGWDFSGAPEASRQAGTWPEKTAYLGDYALRFTTPCADQEVTNNTTVTLQPNTTYSFTAGMYKSSTLDGQGVGLTCTLHSDTLDNIVLTELTNQGQLLWYSAIHTTGDTPETYTVKVGITGAASASAGTVTVDEIGVHQYRAYGVAGVTYSQPTNFPGVTEWGSSVGSAGVIVKNGTITQQGTGGWSHAVCLSAASSNLAYTCEVHDITASVRGWDTKCVGGTSTAVNASVYGGTYSSSNRVVSNRHQGYGAIIHPIRGRVFGVTITDGPLGGIYASGTAAAGEIQFTQNTVRLRARYTNGNGVAGSGIGSQLWRNTVNNGDEDSIYGSRGMVPTRTGTATMPSRLWDNVIVTKEFDDQEYGPNIGFGTWGYGIQLESPTANSVIRVFGNDVTVYGSVDRPGLAFRHTASTIDGQDVQVYDNTFRAVSASHRAACVSFHAAGQVLFDSTAYLDFRDNTLITNEGIAYENTGIIANIVRPHIIVENAVAEPYVWAFAYNASPNHTVLNFIDATFEDSGSESHLESGGMVYSHDTTSHAGYMTVKKAWTTDLTIQGDGSPLASTAVDIVTAQGASAFSGTTDGSGKIAPTIAEWTKDGTSTTTHNPHTVAVTGYENGTLTVDEADETATINLTPE